MPTQIGCVSQQANVNQSGIEVILKGSKFLQPSRMQLSQPLGEARESLKCDEKDQFPQTVIRGEREGGQENEGISPDISPCITGFSNQL